MSNQEFDIRKYQSLLLKMMKPLDQYCRENNIRYSMCGGSLLGAVRHKGIIPWDDDIDILMPRPDYERFLEVASKNFIDGYKVIHAGNTPYYYLPMAKVVDLNTCLIEASFLRKCPIGVNIDVFPIDAVPDDIEKREKLYQKHRRAINFNKRIRGYYYFSESMGSFYCFFKYIRNSFIHLFYDSPKLLNKIEKEIIKESYESARYLRLYTSFQFHNRIFDKYVFEEYIDMEFDGLIVRGIKNYDIYLSSLYKDYMKLPPEEKRVSHHAHYFLDMDRGYTIKELEKVLKE